MLRGIDVPFRMWHQSENTASLIAHAGHIGERAVWIVGIGNRLVTWPRLSETRTCDPAGWDSTSTEWHIAQWQLPTSFKLSNGASSRATKRPSPCATGKYIS